MPIFERILQFRTAVRWRGRHQHLHLHHRFQTFTPHKRMDALPLPLYLACTRPTYMAMFDGIDLQTWKTSVPKTIPCYMPSQIILIKSSDSKHYTGCSKID
ncbi:hypothetical protein AVEN_11550-1 [Araneus ventricosus]|uniref:Uncharacterized protein n=1 Tax=Araneus ventricosus TaxID=182803 RepID=A0A4Y2D3N3_ARAVE|nr:hypothetical protein AVEN_6899-1 [Araneus ventricosus]GBM11313.1 hypothetical protein AVEN_246305-1 [Araneus ventricosus]GBM11324.1 hypothetical protein AVEN_268006-1 [Araneus ventricosus]GBM11341.1 hypothetical protein AVEN_11550-1 [Araneus ventricosus]